MARFREALAPDLLRWKRITDRLQRRGEWETAKLAAAVYNAIHAVAVHAHYQSCGGAGNANGRRIRCANSIPTLTAAKFAASIHPAAIARSG